jgi:putative thioredoxin
VNNPTPITLENFQQVLLEQSKQQHVLIVFYAEQIPESVELLKRFSEKLTGQSAIFLASVDCQAQQQIAMQFGIQGLPTVIMVKDGQPIDGVAGPQTDDNIAKFLEKYLPKPEDELLAKAQQALAENNANLAFTLANQALQLNNDRADIKFVYIEACLLVGKLEQAEQTLATIKMVDQDAQYQALIAKLELAKEAADSPEIVQLEQQLQQNPDDVEILYHLAAQYNQAHRQQEALALLFQRLKQHPSEAQTKQLLLDVIKALPDGDPLASEYRRKLFTLMY